MKTRDTLSAPDGLSPEAWQRRAALPALRTAWVALCLFSTGILLFSLPTYYTYLQTICGSPFCPCGEFTTAAENTAAATLNPLETPREQTMPGN
jgi:hypothetical protein